MLTLPDRIAWGTRPNWPKDSVASASLFGDINQPGLYYPASTARSSNGRYPGYMSAPHAHVTDRLCVVVSGTWG